MCGWFECTQAQSHQFQIQIEKVSVESRRFDKLHICSYTHIANCWIIRDTKWNYFKCITTQSFFDRNSNYLIGSTILYVENIPAEYTRLTILLRDALFLAMCNIQNCVYWLLKRQIWKSSIKTSSFVFSWAVNWLQTSRHSSSLESTP